MITRETLRGIKRTVTTPFLQLKCLVTCRKAPAKFDSNLDRWKCTKCGCDWGSDL